ncbi:hypothetical protein KBY66_13690 [Synechococcus sp. Tobar12-5m-g]|nr:hypothetical protein [Synechococcus sp. Tobar12-5m-g]
MALGAGRIGSELSGELSLVNLLKMPFFFALAMAVVPLLQHRIVYYVLGLSLGATLYPVLCIQATLASPYWWKLSVRELVPFFNNSQEGPNQLFYNSLDILQSSSLVLALSVFTLALFYGRLPRKSTLTVLWFFQLVLALVNIVLSIYLQSRSATIVNLLSLFLLLFGICLISSGPADNRFVLLDCPPSRAWKIILVAVLAIPFGFLLLTSWDILLQQIYLLTGREQVTIVSRELFAQRSNLFESGFSHLLLLRDPEAMNSYLELAFGSATGKTFHNLFIDQYFKSDLWGLLFLLPLYVPVISLALICMRSFSHKVFSYVLISFLLFLFAFFMISLTSSPFKPVYGVSYINSLVLSWYVYKRKFLLLPSEESEVTPMRLLKL